jgi:hypothetical protein
MCCTVLTLLNSKREIRTTWTWKQQPVLKFNLLITSSCMKLLTFPKFELCHILKGFISDFFSNQSCIMSMRFEHKHNLHSHKEDLKLLTIHFIPAYFPQLIHISQCTGPGNGMFSLLVLVSALPFHSSYWPGPRSIPSQPLLWFQPQTSLTTPLHNWPTSSHKSLENPPDINLTTLRKEASHSYKG